MPYVDQLNSLIRETKKGCRGTACTSRSSTQIQRYWNNISKIKLLRTGKYFQKLAGSDSCKYAKWKERHSLSGKICKKN